MTWAIYSREFEGVLHISGSYEGAQRWLERSTTQEKAEFKHISTKIAPADALILFRMFLKSVSFRLGWVRTRLLTRTFNTWLGEHHPLTEKISTQKMARILRAWGARSQAVNKGLIQWHLPEREICPHCGGHIHITREESVCECCGTTEVLQ